jgi:lipoprotein-anchoring transpeptidase ErfK/SrfK
MHRKQPTRKSAPLLTAAAVLSLAAGTYVLGERGRTAAEPRPDAPGVEAQAPAAPVEPVALASDGEVEAQARELPAAAEGPPAEPGPALTRIVVSLKQRRLYLITRGDTLLNAPVAIGMGQDFEFEGKKYHFATPRGRRTVIAKAKDPVWTVPEWHYYEKAVRKGIEVVRLKKDDQIELEDGSFILVTDEHVGRVNQNGFFVPFTPGNEIIFDGKIFVPPLDSPQRRVPDALGPYKLDMGDGYLIHGTHMYNTESIGEAVSHGCVRMNNSDLDRLYHMVERGTPVEII